MAYERSSDAKVRGDSLDAFVENISKTYKNQLLARNAADEMKFNTQVLEQNLSLDDQISYREQQLARVSDDPDEKARITGQISDLKDRKEQKVFADAYLEKLIGYQSGISSIDTVIDFLEAQKATITDQNILDTINTELVKQQGAKFTQVKDLLNNQTEYALKDKTDSVLTSQISTVQTAKNKALIAGDDLLASTYDLQLQSLTKAKTEGSIEKDMKNFAVTSVTGYSTAVKTLDAYNSKISSSASTGPVTIGDVTYSSAKEFWTYKRDSYVADQSNDGFFGRLNKEVDTQVKVLNSKSALTASALADALKVFDKVSGRPELAGYEAAMTAAKQDVIQSGTDLLSDSILNRYAVDYDLGKANGALNTLKAIGGNVEGALTKLITNGASIKQGQVNNILQAAQTAMQNDPSLTPEAALQKALATGAGAVLSPEQLANKGEGDIATEFSTKAQDASFTADPRTTIAAPATPGAPGAAPGTTPTSSYSGGSIVDYLGSVGKASDFTSRQKLASEQGIANYTGTAAQNTQLLNKLKSVTTPVPAAAPTPAAPVPVAPKVSTTTPKATTPAPAPAAAPKPAAGGYQGSSIVDYLSSTGGATDFASRATLATQKGIKGYTGSAAQNTQLLKALRGF